MVQSLKEIIKKTYFNKHLHMTVQRTSSHTSQQLETTEMSPVDEWLDKSGIDIQ